MTMGMTVRERLSGLLVVLFVVASVYVGGAGAAGAMSSGEARLLSGMNSARASNGLAPLVDDSGLRSIARAWSQKMAADYDRTGEPQLAHNPSLGGQIPHTHTRSAENVAYTRKGNTLTQRADRILSLFLDSGGHRKNVLAAEYTLAGVGFAEAKNGAVFATVVFTNGKTPTAPPAQPTPKPPPAPPPAPAPAPPPPPAPEPPPMPTTVDLFDDAWPEGYLTPATAVRWEHVLLRAAQPMNFLAVGFAAVTASPGG